MIVHPWTVLAASAGLGLIHGSPTPREPDLPSPALFTINDLTPAINQAPDPCPLAPANPVAQIFRARDFSPTGPTITPTDQFPPTPVYAMPMSTATGKIHCLVLARWKYNNMWATEARTNPKRVTGNADYDVHYSFTTPLDRIELWAKQDSWWSQPYSLFMTHAIGGPGLSGYLIVHFTHNAWMYLRIFMREDDVKGNLTLSRVTNYHPPNGDGGGAVLQIGGFVE